MKISTILGVSGAAILGAGIYMYYKKQVQFIKDITYQVQSIKIISWTSQQAVIAINAQVFNSSNLSGTIEELYLDVYMNGILLGHLQQTQNIPIYAQSFSVVPVTFTFNPSLVGLNILTMAEAMLVQKSANIEIRGYVRVKSGFITAKAPFSYNDNLASLAKL